MSPEFPPKEKILGNQVRLPESVWQRLKAVAAQEDRSLNEVCATFIVWALEDYELAQARKGKK